jgi:hypothetical protein
LVQSLRQLKPPADALPGERKHHPGEPGLVAKVQLVARGALMRALENRERLRGPEVDAFDPEHLASM